MALYSISSSQTTLKGEGAVSTPARRAALSLEREDLAGRCGLAGDRMMGQAYGGGPGWRRLGRFCLGALEPASEPGRDELVRFADC